MENTFWTALGASSLAAIVTSMGIYVIRRFEQWGRENTVYFICFAAGVLIWTLYLSRRSWSDPRTLITRATWIVAALFLLSPTQFPWYYLWLLPLLALRPIWPLLLYTALLHGYRQPQPEIFYADP